MTRTLVVRRKVSALAVPADGALALTGGCVARETGLVIPEGISAETLQQNTETVARIRGWSAWALGDLLAFHQRHFGNPNWEWVTNATGLGKKYLKIQQWGAEKYHLPDRFPGLSLHHHLRIAHLPHRTRQALLKRASAEQWTLERLMLEAKIGFVRSQTCRRCLMTEDEILACRRRREQMPRPRGRRRLAAPKAES